MSSSFTPAPTDNANWSTAPGRIAQIIATIHSSAPIARVYVASITPSSDSTRASRTATFNAALPAVVDAAVSNGVDARFVNMHDSMLLSDLNDLIHPKQSGYDKMADVWYSALTGTNPNQVSSSGFEDSLSGVISAPWTTESTSPGTGYFGIHRGIGTSRSGTANAWIATNGSGWNALKQSITVVPNQNYRMTVWVQTSSNLTYGYVGLRTTAGSLIGEQAHGASSSYVVYTVNFNSGNNSNLLLQMGYWGNGASTWERFDDVSIVRL